MPAIFLYLFKLSVTLATVYVFYQLVLRHLTFYNSNRWYLLAYSLLAFFIAFVDISPVLEKNQWSSTSVVNWIPPIDKQTVAQNQAVTGPVKQFILWDAAYIILISGILILFARFIIRLVSFSQMKKRAHRIAGNELDIYQVDQNIIPFSFGNSIFINQSLHSQQELKEIIRHEFIHVKQKHSLDILWTEILCIINWYNPFAWLLKKAVRQNLEFIADNKVIEDGVNKKEYQYLLLKTIGNNQFSIATQFNFSSLKKRIAMMNKTKSAKRQLLRLLFLLPATAILLLAFRNKWDRPEPADANNKTVTVAGLVVDAADMKPLAGVSIICKEKNINVQTDERGYYRISVPFENKPLQFSMQISKKGYSGMHQQENWGNFYTAGLHERYGKTIELFALSKTGSASGSFSSITGNALDEGGLSYENVASHLSVLKTRMLQQADTVPTIIKPNDKGYIIEITGRVGDCMVSVKDKGGKQVKEMLLTEWNKDPKYYGRLYGELTPVIAPVEMIPVVTELTGTTAPADHKLALVIETPVLVSTTAGTISATVTTSPLIVSTSEQVITPVESLSLAAVEVPVLTGSLTADVQPNINLVPTKNIGLDIGGLTMVDEGQYILIDGKEYERGSGKISKGPYNIRFINKKEAMKKYGDKAKNGAIIAESITK